VTDDERSRLIDFLRAKMCTPCRRDGASAEHPGCEEAQALIVIVEADG
jgi:hypothetical protein